MQYQAHELSLAFPEMPPDQFRGLAASVKANGLLHDIVLLDGMILDGRHRYRASVEAGVTPRFRVFREGDPSESCAGDPVAFVTSENCDRRHLTESQRAHAAAAMKPYEERKARERMAAGGAIGAEITNRGGADRHHPVEGAGRTAEILAKKVNVGQRTMNRAIKVREQGTEELNAAVAAGEITLNQAEKIVELNPSAQRKIVEAPKERRADALREAINRSDACKRRDARKAGVAPVVELPSTPFVRKFLSGLERMAIICAEDGDKDGDGIATRFMNEMDWSHQGLSAQFDRCQPIIDALTKLRVEIAMRSPHTGDTP